MNATPHGDVLHDLLLGMGKMQGSLESILRRQEEQTKWIARIDERLRCVERKAAVHGMISGGIVGVIVAIFGQMVPGWWK